MKPATQFAITDFDFNKETKLFTVEISMLSRGGRRQVFSQVYNDAIDEGFGMISHTTGKEVVYVVDGIDYQGQDEDREIAGWRLIPTDESKRLVPGCKDTSVLVIND